MEKKRQERQTDRQTEKQTDRKRERQKDRKKSLNIFFAKSLSGNLQSKKHPFKEQNYFKFLYLNVLVYI